MLACFALTVLGVTCPVALTVTGHPRLRARAALFFPLGIIVMFALTGVLAALVGLKLGNGVARAAAALSLAGIATAAWLHFASRAPWKARGLPSLKFLGLLGLVSLLAVCDQFVIHAKNRWGFETNFLFPGDDTFFRFPMNSDVQRHAILIGSILRGDGCPFLAESELIYQIQWHYFASVFVALFDGLSLHSFTCGASLATSFLFFFCLLWSLSLLRPTLFRRPSAAVPLVFLLLAHVDLLNMAASYYLTGGPGISADASAAAIVGVNFSLKVAALTAPQHLIFLLFALAYFIVHRRLIRSRSTPYVEGTFLVLAGVSSPILFLVFMPFLALDEVWRDRRRFVFWSVVTLGAAAGFWIAWGFAPTELFLRRLLSMELGTSGTHRHWLGLPLLWVGMSGGIGVLVTALLARDLYRRHRLFEPLVLSLFAGTLGIHLLCNGAEVHRHWSILVTLIGALYVAIRMPLRLPWRRATQCLAVVGVACHGYFLYSFVAKPSVVMTNLKWRDYFEFNRELGSRFPKLPVIAVSHVTFTPVLEATTSYPTAADVAVHSKVKPSRLEAIKRAEYDGVLPHARKLGYQALVWGPLEDQIWAGRERCRFVDESNLMFRYKSVSLYRLEDALARHPGLGEHATPSDRFALGTLLTLGGWLSEGLSHLRAGIRQESSHVGTTELRRAMQEGLARIGDKEARKFIAQCRIRLPAVP